MKVIDIRLLLKIHEYRVKVICLLTLESDLDSPAPVINREFVVP